MRGCINLSCSFVQPLRDFVHSTQFFVLSHTRLLEVLGRVAQLGLLESNAEFTTYAEAFIHLIYHGNEAKHETE